MTRASESSAGWVAGAVIGGSVLASGLLVVLATWARHSTPSRAPQYTDADVEAAARMLASENPRGTRELHVEQVHTQLRARKAGQSLYDRITAGSGWGPQGESANGGGVRPVSTEEPATKALRQLVREVLGGLHPSALPGARKYFEPAAQDRALAMAEAARRKQAAGQAITAQERRLLGYRRSAEEVRKHWLANGGRFVGSIDGIEFFA